MRTDYLYLRQSYTIAVARFFYSNKFEKLSRITECHLLFAKVKKTLDRILPLNCLNIQNGVIEIKTSKRYSITKNKGRCLHFGSSSAFRQNLFHIFLFAGSQENIKKFCSRPPLPLRFRHLILLFLEE